MQITQAPPLPPTSTAVTQPQTLSNTLPQVLTQAVQPISQKAITPAPKAEKGRKSKTQEERRKGEDGPTTGGEKRGRNVNMSVWHYTLPLKISGLFRGFFCVLRNIALHTLEYTRFSWN